MTRHARIVVPGLPHHVTQRGNRRGPVFFDDWEREQYLDRLERKSREYGVGVWSYCLMPNHVHLVVQPHEQHALARLMRDLQGRYALGVNRGHGWDGHLWAARYWSTPLDETHLWAAVRYVERNPVRAGLVEAAEAYRWSSARTHCGLAPDGPLAPDRPFPGAIADWSQWLAVDNPGTTDAMLRSCTARGLPAGEPAFVDRLEAELGRPLVLRPEGRPPKSR